jgi:hypothetical protein
MNITVKCYAGYQGEETPRRFWMGDRQIKIQSVLDRWIAPDHRYFKVMGDDGGLYILRHDPWNWKWELTFFKQLSETDALDQNASPDRENPAK